MRRSKKPCAALVRYFLISRCLSGIDVLTTCLIHQLTGSWAEVEQLESARSAEWHRLYSKWLREHECAVAKRRVALPLLIKAISATDYGDVDAREDLVSRLWECGHSIKSTAIPLGSCGSFEFPVNPAAHMPISRTDDVLSPLPLFVERVLFPGGRRNTSLCFRLAGRTMQQLLCPRPEGHRQSRYACWSIPPALPELKRTGSPAATAPAEAVDLREPLSLDLDVKKHRTMSLQSMAEDITVGVMRDMSGSSTASSGSESSGRKSVISNTIQSSIGSLPELSSSISIASDTAGPLPGESRMLAAMSGGPLALEDAMFMYIGKLFVRQAGLDDAVRGAGGNDHGSAAAPASSASKPAQPWGETDYIVAVNLCDLAVYLMYIAWHDNAEWWAMTEEECVLYAMEPIEYGRFKPQNDRDWGCLPGFEDGAWPCTRRRVIAKLADNVHHWQLGQLSARFTVGPALLSPDSIPILGAA